MIVMGISAILWMVPELPLYALERSATVGARTTLEPDLGIGSAEESSK